MYGWAVLGVKAHEGDGVKLLHQKSLKDHLLLAGYVELGVSKGDGKGRKGIKLSRV